ncbi:MAG: DUF4956 domain-containing protein [Lachnospiraceae bacterium]|nr:DUF4956 domain-containing protein [Lachnospiraceae bacterium]
MFSNLFSTIMTDGTLTGTAFLFSTLTAFVCGLIIAGAQMIKDRSSKSFLVTLVLLPAIVELVIILVNGNIGAGVAVAGAFSLVRFRSVPGRGHEITAIFLAMAVGLATGMGYIGIAILFTVLVSLINLLLGKLRIGEGSAAERVLRITVPENLDYEGKFEDTFAKYLKSYTYDEVRTTNMGSLYRITLSVVMKDHASSRDLIDELRKDNGNLDISLGRRIENGDSL